VGSAQGNCELKGSLSRKGTFHLSCVGFVRVVVMKAKPLKSFQSVFTNVF
jgi:hypothetical protein